MARRVQFTFVFTNAQPGALVGFDVPVFSSASVTTDPTPDGRLVLDSSNSVVVWADAAHVTAKTTDGQGEEITATATVATPSVTNTDGTAGTSPFESGSGTSSAWTVVNTVAAHYVASDHDRIFATRATTTDVTAPAPGGKAFSVTNTGVTGDVTVLPHAAEDVIGGASYAVTPGATVVFADNNTDWWGI